MFRKGQKVKVIDDLDKAGDQTPGINDDMREFEGQVVTLERYEDFTDCWILQEDVNNWNWTDAMLEILGDYDKRKAQEGKIERFDYNFKGKNKQGEKVFMKIKGKTVVDKVEADKLVTKERAKEIAIEHIKSL